MWEYSSFRWCQWGLSVRDSDQWGLGFLLGLACVGHPRRPISSRVNSLCLSWETSASVKTLIIFWSIFWASSFVNSNTCHLICNNFNLNFIYGIVCLYVCVCTFSLCRESPDMILRDKSLISEVVLSQQSCLKLLLMTIGFVMLFLVTGSNNDINVLNQSSLIVYVIRGHTAEVSFIINGREHHMGYYLTDGIYPSWPMCNTRVTEISIKLFKL
jgi:hypothetical protein